MRYLIEPKTGLGLAVKRGQLLKIIDVAGEQVADLFAFAQHSLTEWLSSGKSIDYNGRISPQVNDILYSNNGNPMFTVVADTVGKHSFLFSPCSQEMFERQYQVTRPHPNCLDNISTALAPYGVQAHMISTPFNIFLNVEMTASGSISIAPPRSRAGDAITLRAEMDLYVAITACAAGACNNYHNTAVAVEIQDK